MNNSSFPFPAPPPVQVSAALEPVQNILLSLWALTANDPVDDAITDPVAVAPWITRNTTQLTPEQRHFNRLLFTVFGSALLPEESYPDFDSYLAALAGQPVARRQDRLVKAAQTVQGAELRAEAEVLLTDLQA